MKNPFAKRKIVIAAAGLLAAFLFSGGAVSAAGDYYDGEKDSHQTGVSSEQSGGSGSVPGTFVEHSAEKVASFVTAGSYGRTNQHVADYANGLCKSGWKVSLADGSWVSYASYNGVLKSSVPLPSSWPSSLYAVIDSNGCLRYKCATCSGYNYAVDAELYGYYDSNGTLTVTGWTMQMAYCENCTPLSQWDNVYDSVSPEYRTKWAVGSVDGQVVGQEFVPDEQDYGYGYQGVYVYNNLQRLNLMKKRGDGSYELYSDFSLAIDPGVLESTNAKEYLEGLIAKKGQTIGSTGKYIFNDETGRPGVEILDKLSNNVSDSFGYHIYKAHHEYINLGQWEFAANKHCTHVTSGDSQDIYRNFGYGGKTLGGKTFGVEGYGFVQTGLPCGFNYPAGGLGFCSDCGEMITGLTYATPETLSTVRRVKNGVGYIYVCPVAAPVHGRCTDMIVDGTTFKYLKGHVENERIFLHACDESSVNQYYLQFESNSPDASFFGDSSYTVGGYFYSIYEDGKSVLYTPEGQTLAFDFFHPTVLENGRVIMADVTPTTSKNKVDGPTFNSKGYIFKEWELYNGSSWVSIGANPTWQQIVSKIGTTSDLLKNDGGIIRLRAQWTTPAAVLKIVDGDTVVNNNVAGASVVGTYNVPFMRSMVVSMPGNKNGVLSFDAGTGVTNPANMTITANFSSFSSYSGNKGVFDTATKTYLNAESTSGRVDYVIANYSWQTITLPSVSKSGHVFMGWYTGDNGTGLFCGRAGAPYTPRGSATLYAYWLADAMSIGAVVTDHVSGKSNVSWQYNNSDKQGNIFYKIYRDGTLLTNGTSVGSTVSETPISVSETTSSGSYTVPNEGVYEITLKGQAGGSVTGASGGKGAVYKLTMYLQKGDVLAYDLGATSGNYGGGTQGIWRISSYLPGQIGSAGNGGNASVLYLTRNGSTNPIVVAGGGGGAMRLASGVAIAGGDAVDNLSVNGTKTPTQDPYAHILNGDQGGGQVLYNSISSGGGGGYRSGTFGAAITSSHAHGSECFHAHSGVGDLVSGTAGAEDAAYSQSGGCYTSSKTTGGGSAPCGGTIARTYIGNGSYTCQVCGGPGAITNYATYSCPSCGHDYGWEGNYACQFACIGTSVWHGNSVTAGQGCSQYRPIPQTTVYEFSCTQPKVACVLGENWGDNDITSGNKEYYTPSTGGSCWYNTSYVMSATFSAGNESTSGSFALSSKLLGITTMNTLTDYDTDDKAAPNTPVIGGELAAIENVASENASNIYLANISWNSADNGTTYEFSGETHDIMLSTYTKRCSTQKNAQVTVTSGINCYEYEVYRDSTRIATGTTTSLRIENVLCVQNQSKESSYSYRLKVRVRAADHAGNWSDWEEKTVEAKYNPPVPSGHVVGVLDKPTVTVSEGNGIYRDGSTYYLKADGTTKLTLTLRATLSTTQKSRITSAALGNNNAKFNVQTPLTNHTANATKAGGGIGALSPSGISTIHVVSDKGTEVSQNFVTSREDTTYVYPYAEANCLGMWNTGCPNATHTLEKQGTPIAIVGDKTAPTVTVTGKTFKDSGNYVDTNNGNWSSTNISLPVAVADGGSGVASVEIRNEDGTTVTKSTPTGRTTNVTVPWTVNTDGIKTYEIVAVDNVGNTTTVNITVRINKQRPVITDNSSGVALNSSAKCMAGTWRSTSTDAIWEYDWSLTRPLAYTVEDTVSGLKSVRFYQTSASYQGVVKNIFNGTYSGTNPVHIFYDVDTEGTSYYVIEAVTMSGTKTTVHVKARRDSTGPIHTGYSRTILDFETFTMAEANNAVNNGNVPDINTTWVIGWRDANLDGIVEDSAGIQSATLYVYNANDTSDMKSYPMFVKAYGSYTAPRVNDFNTPLDGAERWYNKDFTVSINTFVDFPYAAELKWYVEAKDNIGNTRRQYGKTADGSDDIIPNFLVKTVAWATKDGAYNVKSDGEVSNTPYFKTGELGFLEVWTIGYVENIELDFTEGGVGKEAVDEITRGAYDSKYTLGVHGDSPRIVTTVRDHKAAAGGIPDREDGIPYATHYVYNYSSVEHSIGTTDTAGWKNDGTYIRIPPAHTLTSRNEKDKYGNELYFWEVREARVYASKGSYQSSKYAKTPYVIWDESGDDVHYRIIHGTLGF